MKDIIINVKLEDSDLARIERLELKMDKILEILNNQINVSIQANNNNEKDAQGKVLLSITDVEREYGISEYQQRVARKDPINPLEYIIIGGHKKYRRSQIEAYVSSQEIRSEY